MTVQPLGLTDLISALRMVERAYTPKHLLLMRDVRTASHN
jgi:hypothetical protein